MSSFPRLRSEEDIVTFSVNLLLAGQRTGQLTARLTDKVSAVANEELGMCLERDRGEQLRRKGGRKFYTLRRVPCITLR